MIISPFSPLWFLLILSAFVLLAVLRRGLRGKNRRVCLNCMTVFNILVCAVWVLYKIRLSKDPAYDFQIWLELPLHLCNLVSILSAAAMYWDCSLLQGFCFCIGTVGAVLAMLMPGADFTGVPFWSARGLGFYGYHSLVLVQGLSFAVLELYRPKYRDALKTTGLFIGIGAVMHGINLLMRAFLHPEANYFYTFGIEGNLVLELCYRLIPADFFFALPLFVGFGLVSLLMIALARLYQKRFPAARRNGGILRKNK